MSINTDEADRRAEALFKKEQQSREAQQATAEYQAELNAMREKTARLRALRLAREANQVAAVDQAKRRRLTSKTRAGPTAGSRTLPRSGRNRPRDTG